MRQVVLETGWIILPLLHFGGFPAPVPMSGSALLPVSMRDFVVSLPTFT